MHTPDTDNIDFQLAADFVNNTNRPIFLTGKAGTGKTTFLRYIKETTRKQTAVVAPTGVAAINAGGTTMHSFFTLPFGPFIPGTKKGGADSNNEHINDKHSLISRLRYSKEKKEILQSLELLIIDEVSMVRSDIIDSIDLILRYYRRKIHEPFGGVQVLFIGDMHQLPPVVKEDEWQLLQEYYESPYFFDSQVLKNNQPLYIELKKIYRQNEQQFIDLLNQVRNNRMDDAGKELLQSRYKPNFIAKKSDGYITLTTHNFKADGINENELAGLAGRTFSFKAAIDREFSEKSYPAEVNLHLKIGAQVMFLKNDTQGGKKYYNGKIGTVGRIDEAENKIFVICKDEEEEIEVKKETWKNIRYNLNKSEQKLEEEQIGSFTQYPLRLAWAITIHKSQGLTFEKAIIDAGSAFAPGQVYVALSRCTSLEGMVLHSQIGSSSVFSDKKIIQFSSQKNGADQLQPHLDDAKKDYQNSLLVGLFSFIPLVKLAQAVETVVVDNIASFDEDASVFVQRLVSDADKLKGYADKFLPQLRLLLQQPSMPESNDGLQTRLKSASAWFSQHLRDLLLGPIEQSPVVSDSRIKSIEYDSALSDLRKEAMQLFRLMECCQAGFTTDTFLRTRSKTQIQQMLVTSAYAANRTMTAKPKSPHPVLYKQLQELRNAFCAPKNLPIYLVASSDGLYEMSRYLPQTIDDLSHIVGFGKMRLAAYGQGFLDIINTYIKENSLQGLIHEKKRPVVAAGKKEVGNDSKALSFQLFKEGKTVADIARERGFTLGTIESHLGYYVKLGELELKEMMPQPKIDLITKVIKEIGGDSTSPIKEILGEDASYSEIRLVINWLHSQAPNTESMAMEETTNY